MAPILNGNLSIHAIHLKLKKDPFPSKLCLHIPSKMDPSHPPLGLICLYPHYCITEADFEMKIILSASVIFDFLAYLGRTL